MNPRSDRRKTPVIAGGVILALALLAPGGRMALAQSAPDGRSVLVLGSSVRGGRASLEATQAAALGFTVDVASDDEWAAKSSADFASYRAIILGDRSCEGGRPLAAAEANREVWASAVTGSVIVIGTHPAMNGHPVDGAVSLVNQAVGFAAGAPTTGAYITLGCFYDATAPGTTVKLLSPFGRFQAMGQSGCSANAHLVTADAAFAGLSDERLSSWRRAPARCDTDTGFASWPSSFAPVAIARDVASSYASADGSSGSPFILARHGDGLVSNPSSGTLSLSGGHMTPETTSATASTTLNFDGSASVQGITVNAICDDCAPDAFFGGDNVGLGTRVHLDVNAHWSPTANLALQYSPSLLRQGETLDLVDTLTGGSGPLVVTYTVSGDYGIYFNTNFPDDGSIHGTDTTSFSFSLSGNGVCTLKLDGDGNYNCSATKVIPIFNGDLFGLAGIDISLPVTTTLSVTPDGVVTVRSVKYDGAIATGPNTLTFHGPSPSEIADNFAVACTAPAGAEALYMLDSTTSDPDVSAKTSVGLKIEVTIIITVGGTVPLGTLGPGPTVTLHLAAPNVDVDLGPIQPDNKPPVVVAGGPYGGVEGTAIGFSAAGTTDNCAATLSYHWYYSDGGVAFGIGPYHTFADNSIYSGEVVVTDLAGNSASKDFSCSVTNASPAVHAGPDTGSAWGIPVAFNGSAADPGSADQSTLGYAWSFGDGSPSATGGPSVMHSYAGPGTYVATLTVCDKDGSCSADTRSVAVRKRDVTGGFLGDHSGVFDTPASLSAAFVDEFGAAVSGRSIAFAIGSEAAGSSSTSSSGVATVSHVVGLDAGSYTANASFAGDALYNSSSGSGAFSVARKATVTSYTGALSGGPNKIVTLSAVLKDSLGTPLAGRTVAFQIGVQSASAITDAGGVAGTSLKLNQKNGSYALTATFAPAGADANRYTGSSASVPFAIGGKSSAMISLGNVETSTGKIGGRGRGGKNAKSSGAPDPTAPR